MPLTSKGKKIMSALKKQYGSKDKAEEVFYAMKNKRKISGVEEIDRDMGKKPAKKTPVKKKARKK